MEYNEIWAVPVSQLEKFFKQNPAVTHNGSNYLYKNCLISIEKLPEKGILKIPQTQIIMSGEEKETKEIHEQFFLNFLSAGG